MKQENYAEFKERFQEYVAATIDPELLVAVVRADAVIDLKEINGRFYNILKQFAPFGPSNMRPAFISRGVKAEGRVVGEDHLKLALRQDGSVALDGIAFEMAKASEWVNDHLVDVCYNLDVNTFRGYTTLQLMIKDLKPAEG